MNSYSLLQKSGIYSDRQLHKMKFSPLSRVFSVVLTVIVCGLDITASFMDLSVFVNFFCDCMSVYMMSGIICIYI